MAIYTKKENGEISPLNLHGYVGKDGVTPEVNIEVNRVPLGQNAEVVKNDNGSSVNYVFNIPHTDVSDKDKVGYMGNKYSSLKDTNDANVEWLLDDFNTIHYEGQHITATDTYQKQVRSAILKGSTKYKDVETGEIVDEFDPERNLTLESVKAPVLKTLTTLINYDVPFTDTGSNLISDFIEIPDSVKGKFLYPSFNTDAINERTPKQFTLIEYNIDKTQIKKSSPWINNCYSSLTSNHVKLDEKTKYIKLEAFSSYSLLGKNGKIGLTETKNIKYIPHKSNSLTLPQDLVLRSNGSVYDELDLITGKLRQRIGEDNEVLAQEIVKKVDLSGQKVYSYDGTTHYTCSSADGHPAPILSIDVPTKINTLVLNNNLILVNSIEVAEVLSNHLQTQRQILKENEEIQLELNKLLNNLKLNSTLEIKEGDEE